MTASAIGLFHVSLSHGLSLARASNGAWGSLPFACPAKKFCGGGRYKDTARLRGAVTAMLDLADNEKRYLAAASVVSTLFWGFGDCLAKHFGAS
jgi:hypothetical protein